MVPMHQIHLWGEILQFGGNGLLLTPINPSRNIWKLRCLDIPLRISQHHVGETKSKSWTWMSKSEVGSLKKNKTLFGVFTWIWVTLNGKFYGHISCMHSLHGLICYIMIYNDKIYRYEHNICVNNIEYQMISSGFPLWDSNRTPIQQCSIFHDRGVPSFVLDPLPHLHNY